MRLAPALVLELRGRGPFRFGAGETPSGPVRSRAAPLLEELELPEFAFPEDELEVPSEGSGPPEAFPGLEAELLEVGGKSCRLL